MKIGLEFLDRCAIETGFFTATLEKVIRLGEIAGDIGRDALLGRVLALKAGQPSTSAKERRAVCPSISTSTTLVLATSNRCKLIARWLSPASRGSPDSGAIVFSVRATSTQGEKCTSNT